MEEEKKEPEVEAIFIQPHDCFTTVVFDFNTQEDNKEEK
jgi:hypothetical protein